MKLSQGLHLAYCANIHRGESWEEVFHALNTYTLEVRQRVCPGSSYAIGLRLSARAANELNRPENLSAFRRWLDQNHCYVFTINGFPFGAFHGQRVKERAYLPDWTSPSRLEYTRTLFDLLAQLASKETGGSVSTVPASFKEFIRDEDQVRRMRRHLWECVEHISRLSEKTGIDLHLGLEPEPLCFLETSEETVGFINQMRDDRPHDDRLPAYLGVNYDTCHLGVEFEQPRTALKRFQDNDIRISKIHLSSALATVPTLEARKSLEAFTDDVYLHQVIESSPGSPLKRYKDLDEALSAAAHWDEGPLPEWRIHFHIPLHCPPRELFGNTSDHLTGVLDEVQRQPQLCSHFEMETYTWEVMPPAFKNRSVVEQLVGEYEWTLKQLADRGFVVESASS